MLRTNMNTKDLNEFNYDQRKIARKLKNEYHKNKEMLTYNVHAELNIYDGRVYLVDEWYNVVIFNNNVLSHWYSCPICGHEEFLEDMEHNKDNEECQEYLNKIRD